MQIQSYRDYDGKRVKVGDTIAKVDIVSGVTKESMGVVTSIEKQGFYTHPKTTLTKRNHELWGKFTRKIN